MLSLILSTFGVIFVAELPDKTALASLVLAARYPARQVIVGAWLAFLLQTIVSVSAGSLLNFLPAHWVRLAAGVGFLAFAVLALRRREDELLSDEAEAVARASVRKLAPWVTSFLVVFAAEWGDLTQLATAALVANTGQPLPVAAGAIAALWAVTVLAAISGAQVGRYLTPTVVRWASAALFTVVGIVVIVSALR